MADARSSPPISLLVAALALLAPAAAAAAPPPPGYRAGTPALDTISGGPWTLAQGDRTVGPPYDRSLPAFSFGGAPTDTVGGTRFPNLSVDRGPRTPASGLTGTLRLPPQGRRRGDRCRHLARSGTHVAPGRRSA